MYTDIPIERQKLIVRKAYRKRRRLTDWDNEKIAEFKLAHEKKKELTEQQCFFLRTIEEKLQSKGWL